MDKIQNFIVNTLKIQYSEPKIQKKITLFLIISLSIFLFIGIFYLILFTCTNYNQLSNLDEYIEEYKKTDKAEFFDKFGIGMKIMPSYNSEKNVIHMLHEKSVSHNYNYK